MVEDLSFVVNKCSGFSCANTQFKTNGWAAALLRACLLLFAGSSGCPFSVWAILAFLGLALVVSLIDPPFIISATGQYNNSSNKCPTYWIFLPTLVFEQCIIIKRYSYIYYNSERFMGIKSNDIKKILPYLQHDSLFGIHIPTGIWRKHFWKVITKISTVVSFGWWD